MAENVKDDIVTFESKEYLLLEEPWHGTDMMGGSTMYAAEAIERASGRDCLVCWYSDSTGGYEKEKPTEARMVYRPVTHG